MKHDENILVVARNKLFQEQPLQGFLELPSFDYYQETIETNKEFLPRSMMEQDPSYKQIIPYLIFSFDNKIFLMQRAGNAGEQRLKNKYTLGIGGHIREHDIAGSTIFDWATREFNEEVHYDGSLRIQPLGLINDESNAVGQVHLGFAFLLKGDSENIRIRSELQQGSLLSLDQCALFFDQMETWSQIAFTYLQQDFLRNECGNINQ